MDHRRSTNAQLRLLELPRHRLHAVRDEHLPEGPRVGDQPALEQVELLVERADVLGGLERLDLRPGRLEGLACVDVAEHVLPRGPLGGPVGTRWRDGAHLMISASQVALTRSIRFCRSGVISMVSSAPGIIRPTMRAAPSTITVAFSKICGSSW